ncbi:hypothetical protein O3M35_005641 [Rhynocoris fuscipes]|uniref:Uncharacterized protein n=1 Tax=Rhynocoris fuscipes TaxID=488301 RepID=A0AAW1DIZ2_9HEMI
MRRLHENLKSIGPTVLLTNTSKLRILCPPYLKNGCRLHKNFLYTLLMLPNLNLISSWATSGKWCHFT